MRSEISFLPEKCIGCGFCFKTCPYGCHVMENDIHVFNRAECDRCGLCTEECYAQALELIGKKMTVDEVVAEVMKDLPFYKTSGGGMTVSGGEPLSQFAFTTALLRGAKQHELHTCIETSGQGPSERFLELIPLIDIFLYDYKETDSGLHADFTGFPNPTILKNLELLDEEGVHIVLRCPLIPGKNAREEHLLGIADIANRFSHIEQVDLLPYHPLGKSKSAKIGKMYPMEDAGFVDEEIAEEWVATVSSHTDTPVKHN
ncbi:MAG: pyruvate formate lyase-activating protein [Spirochaetales bacterium]|nr:pyruvate formate lyase-activating protein [Spirochaetales bacterium]